MVAPRTAIAKEQTNSRAGNAVSANTAKVAAQVNGIHDQGGTVVKAQHFTPGTATIVQHNLGRTWTGWRFDRIYNWVSASGTPQAQDNGYFGDDRDKAILSLGPFATFDADVYVF